MKINTFYNNVSNGNLYRVIIVSLCALFLILFSVATQVKTAQATDSSQVNSSQINNTESNESNITADTQVYLKVDDSQLKFTAPTRIDFILDADGNFTTPDNVTFSNESVMDIEVKSYKIQSDEGCTGVEDADDEQYSSQKDVYSVKVIPTHTTSDQTNTEYSFSTSYNQTEEVNNEDWVISAAEKSIKLVFDKGRMPHPSRKWSNTAAKLQTVTWTVSTAS